MSSGHRERTQSVNLLEAVQEASEGTPNAENPSGISPNCNNDVKINGTSLNCDKYSPEISPTEDGSSDRETVPLIKKSVMTFADIHPKTEKILDVESKIIGSQQEFHGIFPTDSLETNLTEDLSINNPPNNAKSEILINSIDFIDTSDYVYKDIEANLS